jgi:hypothetical protein
VGGWWLGGWYQSDDEVNSVQLGLSKAKKKKKDKYLFGKFSYFLIYS